MEDIQINNSVNNEEEEDLQDQARIQAEIQDLLRENLNEFTIDGESTVNSSTNISVASVSANDVKDDYAEKYKNAITPEEQLQVLYEVRMRELTALQNEYANFKEEKNREIHLLKNQLILHEAEIRQLQVSKKNCEDILVEQTETINHLKTSLAQKDEIINEVQKNLRDCETELNAYQSEVAELQLKIQTEYGPFNLNAKYNSEELQKSLQEKIAQLENALEEEIKRLKFYEKENSSLKEEIDSLLQERDELRSDNKIVLKNFDEAQKQCRDLIDVIEMAKRESDHLKGLLEQQENYINPDLSKSEIMDPMLLMKHNEKLRRMLLDKSVEIDTLNTKLKYFEDNQKEVLAYRQLQNDVYKKEFQNCNNQSHTKDLLLMQNDLQNYQRTIDDKNQQILNLNSIKQDLQEKIEEMILQTRSEIQNISHKYSLPQLREMTEELEKAEATIKELSEKLEKSEERRESLVLRFKNIEDAHNLITQVEKHENELKETKNQLANEKEINSKTKSDLDLARKEIDNLKDKLREDKKSPKTKKSPTKTDKALKQEYDNLKNQLTQVMHHLEQSKQQSASSEVVENIATQMEEFLSSIQNDSIEKGIVESKIIEWKKLLNEIKGDEHLKKQFKETVLNLKETQDKLKQSEEIIQDLKNETTFLKGEKCGLSFELNKCQKDLKEYQELFNEMQDKIDALQKCIQQKDDKIKQIKHSQVNLQTIQNQIELLKKEISSREATLKLSEESNQELNSMVDKMNAELNKLRAENLKFQTDLKKAHANIKKKNLEKELKNAENDLERSRTDESESDVFKKHLEAKLIKAELKLRDELQLEYQKRIGDIEKRYQDSCKEANALCRQQSEQLQQQEKKYKEYLKMVINECADQVKLLEKQKMESMQQLNSWKEEFLKYKQNVETNESKYRAKLIRVETESTKNVSEWKNWSKHMVSSCLGIDELNKKVREKVLKDMKNYDAEVAKIEKLYNDKIKKKVKNMS